jgi:hypothetical protein
MGMNKDYCYSSDCETYNFDNEHDAILDAIKLRGESMLGQVVTISRGEAGRSKASDYSPSNILDYMSDNAYDEIGEWSEDWPKVSKEAVAELDAMVKDVVDSWADKHNCQPTFYKAVNTKDISFRSTKDNGFDFEYEEVEV